MPLTTELAKGRAETTEKASVDDKDDALTIEADSAALLLAAASSDFAARGLAIIPRFLSASEVETLREECDALVRARGRESDEGGEAEDFLVSRAGCVVQTLPRGSRGALAAASGDSLAAARARRAAPCTRGGAELVLGEKLAGLAEALLRKAAAAAEEEEEEEDEDEEEDEEEDEDEEEADEEEADEGDNGDEQGENPAAPPPRLVLVGEQYIVKPARGGPGTAFAWHADGAWLEAGRSEAGPREPSSEGRAGGAAGGGARARGATRKEKKEKIDSQTYLSVWIPLDDSGPGNGGLVLPGEEEIERAAAARRRRRRRRKRSSKDLDGDEENEDDKDPFSSFPLVAAAGTAVAMASWLRHASGSNGSARPRRAWMPQLKLGAVEAEEAEEVEEEEEGEGGGEERKRAKTAAAAAAAAARETWRVPVPCSFFC